MVSSRFIFFMKRLIFKGWMKQNGNMSGSSIPCLKDDPRIHESWALYLSKFISAYEEELGIQLWGMTPQNEPTRFVLKV